MELVSIVVPVYNVEQYLDQCISSLLKQEYENIEIILVDDGSTDSSGSICDNYSSKYSMITTIHQENKGLSGARNVGTMNAKGAFIAFIDSDDWVSKDYIGYQLKLAEEYGADIVATKDISVWSEAEVTIPDSIKESIEVFNTEEALEQMCYGFKFGPSACKLFRTELIKRHLFPEKVLYEDLAIMYRIIGECKKLVFSNLPKYYYRRRSTSIINQQFDERHLVILNHTENLRSYIKSNFPSIMQSAYFESGYVISQIMPMVIRSNNVEVYRKLQSEMRKYYKNIISDRKVPLKYKIRCCVISAGRKPTEIEIAIENKLKYSIGRKMND